MGCVWHKVFRKTCGEGACDQSPEWQGGNGGSGKSAPGRMQQAGRCVLGGLSSSMVTVSQHRERGPQQVIGPYLTSPGGRG